MIPKEIMKLYEKLAFSRGYEEAFRDFLDVCLYYLSVGMLAEDYRRVEKRYKPYEMELFVQMFYRVSEYSEGFCDVLEICSWSVSVMGITDSSLPRYTLLI